MHKKSVASIKTLCALAVFTSAMHVQAAWELDGNASSLFYVTSKASAVSEINTFTGLSGNISDTGAASLVIDLATVNTNIAIRDERMRDIVFQVGENAAATVSVAVDVAGLKALPVGGSLTEGVTATVNLHGMSQELAAELKVIKLTADSLQIQTVRPLLVSAGSFGLAEGVEQLREIAGLPSINPNVVVNFTLVYKQ